MKEIKFRAWKDGKMYYGVSTNGFRTFWGISFRGSYEYDVPFSEVPLMQFTGLKDKNGKEIYEGDVFKCIYLRDGHADHKYRVYFDDADGRFDLQRIGEPCPQNQVRQNLIDVARYGVIGNIYENPELLK
jgi:uncharacterized phage protein (TIGR01671 family)